jgi:mRNA interferase MazF
MIDMASREPRRGDLFLADLDPVIGHEQRGKRPFLVLSIAGMNRAPAALVIGLPVTTTNRTNPLHVRIEPEASGLPSVSYAMPEMVRSVSTMRFKRLLGHAPADAVETAAAHAGFLVGLGGIRY